jgi:hypothetical protein
MRRVLRTLPQSRSNESEPNENNISDYVYLALLSLINMHTENTRIIQTMIQDNNSIRQSIINLLSPIQSPNINQTRMPNERVFIDNIEVYTPNTNTLPRTNIFSNMDISNTFFDPVPIVPTPIQIESATRIVRYGDILDPLNESCCFSLERFQDEDEVIIIRNCRHIFSRNQLMNWFRENYRCPVCRYDIREYNINNENTDRSNNNILNSTTLFTPLTSSLFSNNLSFNNRRVRQRINTNDVSNNAFDDFDSMLQNISDISNNQLI